jgi:hypothetical protein
MRLGFEQGWALDLGLGLGLAALLALATDRLFRRAAALLLTPDGLCGMFAALCSMTEG